MATNRQDPLHELKESIESLAPPSNDTVDEIARGFAMKHFPEDLHRLLQKTIDMRGGALLNIQKRIDSITTLCRTLFGNSGQEYAQKALGESLLSPIQIIPSDMHYFLQNPVHLHQFVRITEALKHGYDDLAPILSALQMEESRRVQNVQAQERSTLQVDRLQNEEAEALEQAEQYEKSAQTLHQQIADIDRQLSDPTANCTLNGKSISRPSLAKYRQRLGSEVVKIENEAQKKRRKAERRKAKMSELAGGAPGQTLVSTKEESIRTMLRVFIQDFPAALQAALATPEISREQIIDDFFGKIAEETMEKVENSLQQWKADRREERGRKIDEIFLRESDERVEKFMQYFALNSDGMKDLVKTVVEGKERDLPLVLIEKIRRYFAPTVSEFIGKYLHVLKEKGIEEPPNVAFQHFARSSGKKARAFMHAASNGRYDDMPLNAVKRNVARYLCLLHQFVSNEAKRLASTK